MKKITPFLCGLVIANLAWAEQTVNTATVATEVQKNTEQVASISPKELADSLQKIGVSYEQVGNDLNIITDQEVALASIPVLQSYGALNSTATQADINKRPFTYAGVVVMFFEGLIIPNVYKNSALDTMHVHSYLLAINEFGHKEKHSLMTFDFNRALYAKIDWDHFPTQNFMKLAPNFKLDKWYEERLGKE